MVDKHIVNNLIYRIFLLLAGIQIVIGVVWMVTNITYVPPFAESQELMQSSKDFILDEYVGILYPVLLRILSVAGEYFCVPLYVLQLVVAYCAYYTGIMALGSGKESLSEHKRSAFIMAAYAVTFPLVLQSHMSVLPYSLATSMLIFLLVGLKELFSKKETRKTHIKIGICWVISALLLPDYGVIAGCVIVPAYVWYVWKQRRKWLVVFVTIFVSVVLISTTSSLVQTPGSMGRIQKSVGSVMVSRFAWPYFERNAFFWSEEVKDLFDMGELIEISMYPERVIYEFGPKLEAAVGKEQANKLYWEMAVDSIMIGKKAAILDWSKDFAANLCPPLSVQLQFKGIGASYTGWNYSKLHANTPELTRFFVKFSLYSFDVFLILAAINWLLRCRDNKQNRQKNACNMKSFAVLLVGVVAVWYTMTGNGMQDYLKVTFISILWCVLVIRGSVTCCNGIEQKGSREGLTDRKDE